MEKFTFQNRPGVRVTLEPDGDKCHIVNEYTIPHNWLARNEERLKAASGRAPLGDSHGAWQMQFQAPLSLIQKYIPADAWEDEAAWKRLINSAEYRRFSTGRRF